MRKEVGTSSTEQALPEEDLQDVPGGSSMPSGFDPHPDDIVLSSGNVTPLGMVRSSEDDDDEDEMIPLGDGYMMSAGDLRRHAESGGTLPIITHHFHQQSFNSEISDQDLDDEEDEDDMDEEEDEEEEEDVDDEDDSASSCSHESPVSDMTINMRTCNSEGYNTSPDAPNNWKSTPEMKLSARKRMMKQMRFGTDMFVRADRRDLGVLLDPKKTIGKNVQRTRTNFKKSTTSSFSQTGEHEEGGTTVNDLLLSAPKTDPTPQRTIDWDKHGLDPNIINKIRPMVTVNHKNRERSNENGRLNPTASDSIDPNRFCHRSVGVQTLPNDEYPSHYYYHTPNFPPHVIDSPLIKCITPEELPAKKKVIQASQPEGTLRLVIQNFSLMSDTVRGPSKVVQDVPWRIMIMPRQHIVQKKGTTQKCLGFFLQCCPDAYSDSWSCQAAAELKLISQKQGVQNFSRKTNHVYTAKENDWGYSCFMTWADILDEAQGYILNDVVILEVHVKAERAKNILSLGEFRKKISDYIRVAQMQCDRGLIDKAIDCNSQAMKFCKDKDLECCRRLQSQHEELVAQKLKQSIARIERGGDTVMSEPDQASNITALRMAMTGNSTRTSAASRGKRGKDAKSTDKPRDLDQMNEQTFPPVDYADGEQLKANTRNSTSSTVTSDKENDSQKEMNEEIQGTDPTMLNSSGELHTRESHCNEIVTVEQLKQFEYDMIPDDRLQDNEELLKYLKTATDGQKYDPSHDFDDIICKPVKHGFSSHTSGCQTDFPPLSEVKSAKNRVRPDGDYPDPDPVLLEADNLYSVDSSSLQCLEMAKKDKKTRKIVRTARRSPKLSSIPLPPPPDTTTDNAASPGGFVQSTTTNSGLKQTVTRTVGSKNITFAGPMTRVENCGMSKKGGQVLCKGEIVCKGEVLAKGVLVSAGGDCDRVGFRLTMEANVEPGIPQLSLEKCHEMWHAIAWGNIEKVLLDIHENAFRYYARICFEDTRNDYIAHKELVAPILRENLHRNLKWEELLFSNVDRVLTKRADEKGSDFEKRKARAAERAQMFVSFHQKLMSTHARWKKRDPLRRCQSYPSLAAKGKEAAQQEMHRTHYWENMNRIAYHLYEFNNRLGFLFLKVILKVQDRLEDLMNVPNVSNHLGLVHDVIDFCQEHHLINRKAINFTKPKIETDDLPTIDEEDILKIIYNAKNGHDILNYINTMFEKIMRVMSDRICVKPLVRSIMTYATQLEEKNTDLKNEMDLLRKDQKAWNKEKNQLMKSQKFEKAQMDAAKQECAQMRSAQKALQKKEAELSEELERVRAQLESAKTKAQERESQHSRELQSLNDVKRNYTKELAERQSAVQKLKEQLDDRSSIIKKLEQSVSQEKRQSQKMVERAKTAEIALLDHRMDQAVRTLERTRTECDTKIEQFEQRMNVGHLTDAEINRLQKDVKALQKVREDINKLIEETRAEGQKNIDQLKDGKQLSQLGRISFSKPPTLPALEPMPPYRVPPPQVPPSVVPLPTPAQLAGPPPSTPEFTPPGVQQPKHFVPPHSQAHMAVRTPLNVPPPQHSPATSAFRPLSSGPSILGTGNVATAVPPNFTSQPPPPFMPSNGSIQHQHMAPYLSSTQPTHHELAIFMPSNVNSSNVIHNAMPGPIGSRPLNFQQQQQQPKPTPIGPAGHNVETMKMAASGPERMEATNSNPLNTSPSASSSSARRGVGIDGVRSLWEDDTVREVFDNADSGSRSGNGNSRGTPNSRPNDPTSNDIWGGYFSWMLDK